LNFCGWGFMAILQRTVEKRVETFKGPVREAAGKASHKR
jgi:hypothetical protein